MSFWYNKSGIDSDVVISTRVRFARNLSKYPFPCRMQPNDAKNIIEEIKKSIFDETFYYINPDNLNRYELISMAEKHLISPDFLKSKNEKGLLLSKDESISIMINEEDHVRLQVMSEGFNLDDTFYKADELDTILDQKLNFAFDEKLGFLTQCPTNLGTGMRASLMLHLPALKKSGVIDKMSDNLLKLGLTIRGIYGEGSESKGDIYQLSNQISLGLSEKAAIKNLKDIANQIIIKERSARLELIKQIEIVDLIHRSLGILQNAYLLNINEFMELISNVRLGIETKEIQNISLCNIDSLILKVQKANLFKISKKDLNATDLEERRAEIVRKTLCKNIN